MKTIEERIQEILAEHHECRWMDTSDLEGYLRRIATEQKAIDIEKAKRAFCKAKECVPYDECNRANGGCFTMQRFIQAMEDEK